MRSAENQDSSEAAAEEKNDSKATSPTLLAAIGLGKASAWERLVACYQPIVMAWCRSKGLDEATSFDVAQETFLSVSRSLPKFQSSPGSGAFRAWLWRITQYRILDQHRQNVRQPHGIGGSSAAEKIALVSDPTLESNSNSAGLTHSMTIALETMSKRYEPRTWNAFLRTVIDGRSTEEVATEFEMTVVGVRQLRSRILRSLRAELGGSAGGPLFNS